MSNVVGRRSALPCMEHLSIKPDFDDLSALYENSLDTRLRCDEENVRRSQYANQQLVLPVFL